MIFLVLVILLLPALGEAQELTRAQKDAIIGGNAARLLRLKTR